MKNTSQVTPMKTIGLLLILLINTAPARKAKQVNNYAYHEATEISHRMKFERSSSDNHLRIFNVYGSVNVEGYAGQQIQIQATKLVYTNDQNLLAVGQQEIGLKYEQIADKIYVYLDSPYTFFDRDKDSIWHSETCWRRDDCSRKRPKPKAYKYNLDITVKVPNNTNLNVSTINNGDISIKSVAAKTIQVNNINGGVDMVDVAGQTKVNAINQDINIIYSQNPVADSSYESINGDLNITYADQPNAEVVYQTMNGEMYSAFDVSMMAPVVKRTSKQKKHGIQYKLDAESRLKIGSGGPEYRFQTLNGDIKIQRQ